jgi:hypothetical protein
VDTAAFPASGKGQVRRQKILYRADKSKKLQAIFSICPLYI